MLQVDILFFFLVMMRCFGFIFQNPVFGRRNVPARFQLFFALALSIVITSFYDLYNAPDIVATSTFDFMMMLFREFIVGYVIGFVVYLFFYIIILAGEFMDMQMGFSMAKVYDPQSNMSLSVNATFQNILLMLLFFSTNAHLELIRIFMLSHNRLPYGTFHFAPRMTFEIIEIFRVCTVLGAKMALPVIGIDFLVEVGVGIVMKSIPQVNIFIINLQMRILVGLIMIFVLFSPMSHYVESLISEMLESVATMIHLMGG